TSAFDIMRRQSYWYGNGGIATLALAAIDMAHWDLQATMLGTSVLDLLGRSRHRWRPVLASRHPQSFDMNDRNDGVATEAEGLSGIKSGMSTGSPARLGESEVRDQQFVAGIREALGPEAIIALDARAASDWTLPEAVRRINAWSQWNLAWVEEPLP